ncbi:MAG: family 14 glycosylhydrolase [Bryobacterales bacterium]|nr:family 14 glycosylhydrolase [Bryobacterales bacterium]
MHRILFFILISAASAKDLASWEASDPPRQEGIHLEKAADSPMRMERAGGAFTARLSPSTDYYTRSAYHIVVERPTAVKQWLVLEFADRGYGLITLTPGLPQIKQWGVARVNSGKVRSAVFAYDGAPPGRIRVEGLDWLRAVRLVDTQPPADEAPLVKPALKFSVPSERVSSVSGDATTPDRVRDALAGIRNEAPLIRALGFNAVETYVRWGYVERRRGVYDWSFYDAILGEIERNGLEWFPMLLAGSGYALPAWLHDSKDNYGFKCLEHGVVHDTQSIFQPFQAEYASRFIAEFGKHYGNRKSLLGIRLGPSGDYGEAQYPARGPGYGFRRGHTHIGYWAGDELARAAFRSAMKKEYSGDIGKLNAAWESHHASFEDVTTFLPETALTPRQRIDFANWYMGAMSEWCERWANWARAALPHTQIHQSSGGWGPVPIGTDYSYQARSMARIHGGIRLTNESDDFPDNFTITRMASSAARFYGAALGYEPGGFGSKRGVMARLFNAVTTGAVHLFYYLGNLTANDQAIDAWLKYGNLLDARAKPVIDVAAFYPDTALKLDDELVRYRWASTFFTVARAMREQVDFDYASEQMILDGALSRYKVLLFLWGSVTEKPVLERIDQWVRAGGTLVFAPRPRGNPITVEGDSSISTRWLAGDTGKGRVVVFHGDLIPSRFYAAFVRDLLLKTPGLDARTLAALGVDKPDTVYWSALENGKLALLNFDSHPARVRLATGKTLTLPPYEPLVE